MIDLGLKEINLIAVLRTKLKLQEVTDFHLFIAY